MSVWTLHGFTLSGCPEEDRRGDRHLSGTRQRLCVGIYHDRINSLETLREKDNWVVWKTKDDKWTQELRRKGFHQLLNLKKDTRDECWGNKIKGW
jgi:hypothetical protein